MKKILILLFVSLLIVSNSNAESFSSALSKAFKNNSELNAERENINVSEQELKISQGNYLPILTLSGSKSQEETNKLTNQSGSNATINDVNPTTKSISISQTLIDFGKRSSCPGLNVLEEKTFVSFCLRAVLLIKLFPPRATIHSTHSSTSFV